MKINTNSVITEIRQLEISTKKITNELVTGNYRSYFRGTGTEFSNIREYIPGDDTRTIDWNTTVRLDYPYVKEFIEEKNIDIFLALDVSASNNFGFNTSKKEIRNKVTAAIMFAALKNNDSIGICLFTDEIEKIFRPKKGRRHVMKMLKEIISYKPKNRKTNVLTLLDSLQKILKKTTIVFIISDFISDFSSKHFVNSLQLLSNKHDLVPILLYDNKENEIPNLGYICLNDEETEDQIVINTSNHDFRTKYLQMTTKTRVQFLDIMKQRNIQTIQINSDKPLEIPLIKFFKMRKRRY